MNCHSHNNIDQKKSDTKEYTEYYAIHIKFKKKVKLIIVSEIRIILAYGEMTNDNWEGSRRTS